MHSELLQQQINELLQQPVYELDATRKRALLLPLLNQLHHHHRAHCAAYAAMTTADSADSLEQLAYVAVRLFKHLRLLSVEEDAVFKILQSSGTSGQTPATVVLDKVTAAWQSKALVKILQSSIGKQRLPMLIIDSPAVLKDRQMFTARGAGIQGLSMFGRDHTYALHEAMEIDWQVVDAFAQRHEGQPVLIFGFTFMVWRYFLQALQQANRELPFSQGVLLHSGGWKKLIDQQVDDAHFQQVAKQHVNVSQVINFYGMAEQVGSVFVQCSQGHLHTPLFADIIIRDPMTLSPCEIGQTGLIQVLSVLPHSYPGISLLTEDLGQYLGEDDCPCGWKGRYFRVQGRLPKAEVRGCSDTQ